MLLAAGDMIPADCLLVDAKDLHVNEAPLTGETFPVEKLPGTVSAGAGLSQRSNSLFLGTNVVSGTARAVAVNRGTRTEFGKVSERLQFSRPETEFERGVRRFGNLLLEVTLLLVVAIFAINVGVQKEPVAGSVSLLPGAGGGADAATAAGDHLGQPGPRCAADGGTAGHRPPARLHREFRQYGRPLFRQNGDADGRRRRNPVGLRRAGTRIAVRPFSCLAERDVRSGVCQPDRRGTATLGRFDAAGYVKVDEVPYDFLRKRLEHSGGA